MNNTSLLIVLGVVGIGAMLYMSKRASPPAYYGPSASNSNTSPNYLPVISSSIDQAGNIASALIDKFA